MTTDPPETRAQDRIGTIGPRAPVDWGRVTSDPTNSTTGGTPTLTNNARPPERDPSNLNDPKLQRWVIAFAWLLVLVIIGTCAAGVACLFGAFQRCECEENDG